MSKISPRQRIVNWCTTHGVPLRLYRWLCKRVTIHPCGHDACKPTVVNPAGMCIRYVARSREFYQGYTAYQEDLRASRDQIRVPPSALTDRGREDWFKGWKHAQRTRCELD